VCDNADPCAVGGDADGDGTGDACDPCNNIVPVVAVKPRIRISKLNTQPGDERLRFTGSMTVPTSPSIDPAANGVRILINDSDRTLLLDVTVPGGAAWRTSGNGTTWRYKNVFGPAGIVRVLVKARASTPGWLKFVVIGKNVSFLAQPTRIPLLGTLVIDAPLATTGQCGESAFPGAPRGRCTYSAGRGSLACK
jgi:hypothetical protein